MRFGMADCKPISAPMETGVRLSAHDVGDAFDVATYQQAVGCLIYLCITRFDIQYAVSQLSRFMHCPGTKHWQACKRVFRYLKGTIDYGIFYQAHIPVNLVGYIDNDLSRSVDDSRST